MSSSKQYSYGNSKCKIQWDNMGFIEILNEPELAKMCLDAAEDIARHAGEEHYTAKEWYSHKIGKLKGGRVAALVYSDNEGSKLEATDKKLSKAVSSCRT